uniref:Uncharacterized protein n=1 Tax=Anguilla anguilla TaxID=7936 RepID=A0A0E9T3T8_ANGAN
MERISFLIISTRRTAKPVHLENEPRHLQTLINMC